LHSKNDSGLGVDNLNLASRLILNLPSVSVYPSLHLLATYVMSELWAHLRMILTV